MARNARGRLAPRAVVRNYWRRVPGWFDFADLYDAQVNAARDGARFAEIGTWLGRSTCYLGETIRRSGKRIDLVAVDTFKGSPEEASHRGVRNLQQRFERNLQRAGTAQLTTVLPMESVQAAARFPDRHFDFVFIDGAHDYASVRADILAWWPKVKLGGILAGHDLDGLWPGLAQAVAELVPGYERVSRCCWAHRKRTIGQPVLEVIPEPDRGLTARQVRQACVYIATPRYLAVDGYGDHSDSILQLTRLLWARGIGWMKSNPNGEMVARARNRIVADFLASEATHLLFVDSDISFRAADVVAMLQANVHVVGGVYPKKIIDWQRVHAAVQAGAKPEELREAGLDYVFNPVRNANGKAAGLRCAVEVAEIGTGFLLIHRSTFERLMRAYPELAYHDDYSATNGRLTYALFDYGVEQQRYLSEDFRFCCRWRAIGGRVWAWPWAPLTHTGMYKFPGNFARRVKMPARGASRPLATTRR